MLTGLSSKRKLVSNATDCFAILRLKKDIKINTKEVNYNIKITPTYIQTFHPFKIKTLI